MIDSDGGVGHDARAEVAAVGRRLGLTARGGDDAAVLNARRSYPAARREVWDAITNPERIPRWFLPLEGDLRVGGRYQLQGNAGGTIERCEPPGYLAVTWEFGDQVSRVEVTLTGGEDDGDDDRTTVELVHTLPVDDHWRQFGPGAVGIGWDLILLGLGRHLEADVSLTPDTAARWLASDEGRAFMTSSGEQWKQANVAAGTDPGEAAAAAARCLAAYLGTPADAGEA